MKSGRSWLLSVVVAATAITMSVAPYAGAQDPLPQDPGSRKIVPVPRENIKVNVWFDKQCGAQYTNGEKIIINFSTNQDAYVTVYDIDTRGQVSVLFPNRIMPDNFVRAGRTYSMPNPSYTYDFLVDGPSGIEYVDVVASQDQYYHWDVNKGEPSWLNEWGLKGVEQRSMKASQEYQQSVEFQNMPQELGQEGEESLATNVPMARELREQIRSKIIVSPRVTQQPRPQDYGTATCYFYVVGGQTNPFPTQPPRPYPTQPPQPIYPPSQNDYLQQLQQQEQALQQIPSLRVIREGDRLRVTINNEVNGRTFLFTSGSYALRPEAKQDLDMVANVLQMYPQTSIIVSGHTDSIGSVESNQMLSEKRAMSVAQYLVLRGVAQYRVTSIGYGESQPIESNANELGRQLNRRVVLEIRYRPQ
jgi:outer membrane protein OmpA-like peptidoglycan-associated protein